MSFPATIQCDARGAERHAVRLDGTLRKADRAPLDVTVTDLSTDGFCAEGPDTPAAGTTISIGIPGLGTRRALVVRGGSGEFGCRFDERLTTAELSAARVAIVTAPIPFPESARSQLEFQAALPPIRRYPTRLRVAAIVATTAAGWGALLSVRALLG